MLKKRQVAKVALAFSFFAGSLFAVAPASHAGGISEDELIPQGWIDNPTLVKDQAASDQNTNNNANNATSNEESSALADQIIATGEKYMGTPYEFGAKSGQTRTFDCSSFTQHVFKENGIDLPRNSRQQSQVGTTVSKDELKKGDLLFFTTSKSSNRIGHVGIYAGNNKILHTYGPGGVRYDSLSKGWLQDGFVTAKRVISE